MPEKVVLFTRTDFDDATSYIYAWTERVVEAAKKRNLKVVDLKRERANRKDYESVVSSQNPVCILFNGHGNSEEITGHNNCPLVTFGENHETLKGKVIYARACSAAAGLGAKSVAESGGPKAFIGYEQDFLFYLNNTKTATPTEDDYARPCLDASNAAAEALIKGNSAGEAYRKSQERSKKGN